MCARDHTNFRTRGCSLSQQPTCPSALPASVSPSPMRPTAACPHVLLACPPAPPHALSLPRPHAPRPLPSCPPAPPAHSPSNERQMNKIGGNEEAIFAFSSSLSHSLFQLLQRRGEGEKNNRISEGRGRRGRQREKRGKRERGRGREALREREQRGRGKGEDLLFNSAISIHKI